MPQPQPLPDCDCVAFCVVDAELPAVAVDETVFACDTEPSSPGLSTRIDTFVFDGWSCVAVEIAPAPCFVPAD